MKSEYNSCRTKGYMLQTSLLAIIYRKFNYIYHSPKFVPTPFVIQKGARVTFNSTWPDLKMFQNIVGTKTLNPSSEIKIRILTYRF